MRPQPLLRPPPSMSLPVVCLGGSAWDILRSFAPDEKQHVPVSRSSRCFGHQDAVEKEDEEDAAVVLRLENRRLGASPEGFIGNSLLSRTNHNGTSSTTAESVFHILPNGRVRKKIQSWNRGAFLGSGSFGTVYEGISE